MTIRNTTIRISFPVIIIGTAALLVFILLLPRFYPFQAVHLTTGKSQAIALAEKFLAAKGYHTQDYHIRAFIDGNTNGYFYLQHRFGWQQAQNLFKNGHDKGLGFYWRITWYKNLPKSTPYEQFEVLVSGSGKMVSFSHEFPPILDWPQGRQAHISQEKALVLANESIREMGIPLPGFQKESFTTQKFTKRTDHTFIWSKTLPAEGGKANLTVVVQGDEVGVLVTRFGIPPQAADNINRAQNNSTLSTFISYIFAFLFCLSLQVLFLKKYHEGEVSVKTGAIVFFICWLSLVLESILKFIVNGAAVSIGLMPYNTVSVVMLLLFSLILWPFFSIMGFSAWSIGESLGRERFNKKFAALDSLFNKKWATLNTAVSTVNGYFFGFLGLGIIALLSWLAITFFNAKVSMADYQDIAAFLPFFIPFLAALSSSLLAEMSFRLFANLYLYKFLKSRGLSLLFSALLWTIYAVGFWSIGLELSPMVFSWLICFVAGLVLGYGFWKFDLLTTIVANFTIIGVMKSLPLLTAPNPEIFYQGIAALVLLFLPVFWVVLGLLNKTTFSYEADLIPEHIKRITERARMSKELEIARQVQMQLLPRKSPQFGGFEIEGICMPAHEVGGDYYDFIKIDASHLGIVIGDVSGKGVPAAIYMTLTKGIIQAQVENHMTPQQVLTRVNRSLYAMMDHKHFVTLFFAVIDSIASTLTFSRAGHNPLLYFRHRDNEVVILKPGGIALGIEKGAMFEMAIKTGSIHLEPNDLVVFYTDGFTEAMNKNLEEYGEKKMIQVILNNKTRPVAEIIQTVILDVQAFVKSYPQHDDMTMVIVKCN